MFSSQAPLHLVVPLILFAASALPSDYNRVPVGGYGNATIVSETNLVGSFPAGPRMARGVVLLFGALLFKFVGLVLAYGVPVPTGVMLPSIMVRLVFSWPTFLLRLRNHSPDVNYTIKTPLS